jgi:Tfp pilus assembly protein PilV
MKKVETTRGMRRVRQEEQGINLLEMMMAVLLITMSFLGIARLMTVGAQSATKSKVSTSTVTLAQEGIENLQSQPFSEISLGTSTDYLDQYGNAKDPVTQAAYSASDSRTRFTRDITVTSMLADSRGNPIEVEIVSTVTESISSYGKNLGGTTFTTRRWNFGVTANGTGGGSAGGSGSGSGSNGNGSGNGHGGSYGDQHGDDHRGGDGNGRGEGRGDWRGGSPGGSRSDDHDDGHK